MDLKVGFKRYYERHKAFRESYCDKQINKMILGNALGAVWMLFVAFFVVTPDYITYTLSKKIVLSLAFFDMLALIAFIVIKNLPKDKVRIKQVLMEYFSLIVVAVTMIWGAILFGVMFPETDLNKLLNPIFAWPIAWTLYTVFIYFPLYIYLPLFIVSLGSLFIAYDYTSLNQLPLNMFMLALILYFGASWRYSVSRENFEISEENRRLLESDRLTGVYNRRSYEERIVALREGKDAEATLVLFDVNGLKPANDTHGHLAGDELIIATANCISRVFDAHGKCFRIGGDEFVVVMEDNAEDINKLMKQFDETTAQWKGNYSDTLSVSYGIAQGKTEGDGISELIKTADANMYEAKRRYYVERGIERRAIG